MRDNVFSTEFGHVWEDAELDFGDADEAFPGTAFPECGMVYSPSPRPLDLSRSFSGPIDTSPDAILSPSMWDFRAREKDQNVVLPVALSSSVSSMGSSAAGDYIKEEITANQDHMVLISSCDGATGGSPDVSNGEVVSDRHVDAFPEPMPFPREKQPSIERTTMRGKSGMSRMEPTAARTSRSQRRAARREVAARRRALLEQALRLAGEDVNKYPLLRPSGWVLDPEAAIPVVDSQGELDDSSVSGGSGSGTGSRSIADDGQGMGEESSDPKVRRQARLARNRASACRSRQRKKQEVYLLQKQLAVKEEECQRLWAENCKLKKALYGAEAGGGSSGRLDDQQQYSPLSTGSASTVSRDGGMTSRNGLDRKGSVSPLSLPQSQSQCARPRRSKRPRMPKERYSPDAGDGGKADGWGDSGEELDEGDELYTAPVPAPSSKRRRIGGRRGLPMLAMALAVVACVIAALQEAAGGVGGAGGGVGGVMRRAGGERKLFAMDAAATWQEDTSLATTWSTPVGFVLMATGARELAMAALLLFVGLALVAVLIAWLGSEDDAMLSVGEQEGAKQRPPQVKRSRGCLWNPAEWMALLR